MEYYFAQEMDNEAMDWRRKAEKFFSDNSDNVVCINPLDFYNDGVTFPKNDFEIMRFDFRKVEESDVILVNLKDIRNSLGTSDEILYAHLIGKPIIGFVEYNFSSDKDIINYVHNWKYNQIDRIETGIDALSDACEYILSHY